MAFHFVLGVGLLVLSLETLIHALAPANRDTHLHIAIVAAVEAAGAALFLVPRTMRVGALLLLLTVAGAFVAHAVGGSLRIDLAIYGAGVWYVYAHGAGQVGGGAG
jgi:hypothetical protein